jgi:hypothetical protein
MDLSKAKRMFNALLLPVLPQASGQSPPRVKAAFGGSFSPLKFGRAAQDFHVDHLIPESLLKRGAGDAEGRTLRNFAPLPSNQNRAAKATSCSTKLGSGGVYDNYVNGAGAQIHPFNVWLVQQHALQHPPGELDDQAKLEPNQAPDIGTERIDWVSQQLLGRL